MITMDIQLISSQLEKEVKGLDRIVLTNDSMVKIIDWEDKDRDVIESPVMQKGFIQVDDNFYTKFVTSDDEESVDITIYFKASGQDLFYKAQEITYFIKENRHELKIIDKNMIDDQGMIIRTLMLVIKTMLYMGKYKGTSDSITVTKVYRKKSSGAKKSSGKKKRNVVRFSNHIYSVNEIEPSDEKRKYERHTDGWNVRGFWRTYKNGKRVWIKPHQRGDKNNIVAKDYII